MVYRVARARDGETDKARTDGKHGCNIHANTRNNIHDANIFYYLLEFRKFRPMLNLFKNDSTDPGGLYFFFLIFRTRRLSIYCRTHAIIPRHTFLLTKAYHYKFKIKKNITY
uniref:Uncharacterized protein n=1 Tax=Sipha flava TaxID=143950 RepID=A0A2S2QXY9_9HEMI